MHDTHIFTLFKRLGLLLLAYMLLRFSFYVSNIVAFSNAAALSTVGAFFYGIRFDLAAIFSINVLFIVLSLLPFRFVDSRQYQRVLRFLFFATNLPFLVFNVVDIEFFKFIGRRSSDELFTITADVQNQALQLLLNYWALSVPTLLFFLLLLKLYPNLKAQVGPVSYVPRYVALPVMIGLSVLFIRGGIQFKPLRTSHAFIFEEASLGHLSLNSSFTFIKSIGDFSLERKNYFNSQQELLRHMQFNPNQFLNQKEKAGKENVVIVILESFGAEYTGIANSYEGYTPFLDSLATEGLYFRNSYANGRKSIEALPSILAGLPALMPTPYITSTYQANNLTGIGSIAKNYGYSTSFYHGATNGTMGFDNFSRIAGFTDYYGLNEYPSQVTDYDGKWGIFDEPFLQFFAENLSKTPQPFLSAVFTLSSHQPYTIPAKYQNKFPKGELEIHESIGYADFALRQFFKTASQQPWYESTLFIITADHTQMSNHQEYQTLSGAFRVPLLLFHPAKELKQTTANRVVQHADILPTIVDYLNFKTDAVLPFGSSVFDSTTTGKALFLAENQYVMLEPEYETTLSTDDVVQVHSDNSSNLAPTVKQAKGEKLKAFVQYFNNALLDNNLYFWQHPN